MKITVHQQINRAYYEEFYSEWLEHRSVYRKWQQSFGVICILLGIGVLFFGKDYRYLSMVLVAYGGYMIYDFMSSKKIWMKQRIESGVNDKSFTMVFDKDSIKSNGPFTKSESSWEFYKDIVETKKGVFLIPENGVSIYLQKKNFETQEDLKMLVGKVLG